MLFSFASTKDINTQSINLYFSNTNTSRYIHINTVIKTKHCENHAKGADQRENLHLEPPPPQTPSLPLEDVDSKQNT